MKSIKKAVSIFLIVLLLCSGISTNLIFVEASSFDEEDSGVIASGENKKQDNADELLSDSGDSQKDDNELEKDNASEKENASKKDNASEKNNAPENLPNNDKPTEYDDSQNTDTSIASDTSDIPNTPDDEDEAEIDDDSSIGGIDENFIPEIYTIKNVKLYENTKSKLAGSASTRSVSDGSYSTVNTWMRLDMFNTNMNVNYAILNSAVKYIVEDTSNPEAASVGLYRVVYCVQYSKDSPNNNYGYTFSANDTYRPSMYVLTHGVRYVGQIMTDAAFSTGLGWEYDYYVTQMALHIVRGEFTFSTLQNKMLSRTSYCNVSAENKQRILNCIANLVNCANTYKDNSMFPINGDNYVLWSTSGSTTSQTGYLNTWTRRTDGIWVSPTVKPIVKDSLGADLRSYYIDMQVTTDVSGVNVYKAASGGGTISQGFHLYCSDARYKELQETSTNITVTCTLTIPNAFTARTFSPPANNLQSIQYLGAWNDWGTADVDLKLDYSIPQVPGNGKIYVKKISSMPEITDNNNCYSLEGAEYTVYADSACTQPKGSMTTDSSGVSNTLELPIGTYYVKETKAPGGYAKSDKVHTVKITASHAASPLVLNTEDIPQTGPAGIFIKKVDAETAEGVPQGGGTLRGAEFTVKYYDDSSDNKVDPSATGKKPVRTWVFKTDEEGLVYYHKSSLVSGDDLYISASGEASLPVGKITIQETKAPEGYLRNDTLFVVPITSDGTTESVAAYAIPVIPENSLKLKLKKMQSGTDKTVPGAVFEHTNPDHSTERLITDENGELSFAGLTWGNHTIKEVSVPDGYTINTNEIKFSVGEDNIIHIDPDNKFVETDTDGDISFMVNEEGNIDVIVEEKPAPFKYKVIKKNDKGTSLEGAGFTLYSDKECKTVIDKKETDSNGILTMENMIAGKKYYLKETKAPSGYKLPEKGNLYEIYVESVPVDGVFDFYINGEKFTVSDTDTTKNIYLSGSESDRIINMNVVNHIGLLLPETGSNMTIFFICTGGILMTAALLYNKVNNKKSN